MSTALENMDFDQLLELSKKQQNQIHKMQSQMDQMQFQIDQMKRLMYGAKRERFIPNQDENQMQLPFEV